jgi:hypothetical protein
VVEAYRLLESNPNGKVLVMPQQHSIVSTPARQFRRTRQSSGCYDRTRLERARDFSE